MKTKTTKFLYFNRQIVTAMIFCVFFAFFISACGGGGSSTDNAASNNGSIAFSVDWKDDPYQSSAGAYIASSLDCAGAGVSQVTAEVYDQNGTYLVSGGPWNCSAHSGTINNVPEGSNMMVVVTGKDSSGNEIYGGEATNLNVVVGQTTNAGTIETVNIDMPVGDLLTHGFDNLKDGAEMLLARDYFYGAKIKLRSSASNEADIARFFYAIAKVAAQAYSIEPDGVNDGLQDLGDIMDAFGFPPSGRLPLFNANGDFRDNVGEYYYDNPFPATLPFDSPTGADLQNFCFNRLRPALEVAIASFNLVSSAFNKSWQEPVDDGIVDSDYGDLLYFKAMFQFALASIYIQKSYALDVNIYESDSSNETNEEFIGNHPDFGKLTGTSGSYLGTAKSLILSALSSLDAAIVWMQNETDAQSNDWVNLVDETGTEIQEARLDILDVKNSLNGPTLVRDNGINDPLDPDDDPFTLNLSRFFAGLDFRNPNRIPLYTGDDPGYFPDPTFNGIVGPEEDLNKDFYSYSTCPNPSPPFPCRNGSMSSPAPDGVPDILQEEDWYISCSSCIP